MYGRRLHTDYYFYWQRQAIRFCDGKSTKQFLSQFKNDSYALTGLRSLLSEARGSLNVSRLTGEEVLAAVADLILSGELEIVSGLPLRTGGASSTPPPSDPAPMPGGAPLGRSGKSDEPESDTFSSDTNPAIQAAALSAAANRGAAFCPQ